MLLEVVNPPNTTLFNGRESVFQQDATTAHKDKSSQEWLRRKHLVFISAENWLSRSPGLKPVD